MKISLVIRCYNEEQHIGRLLDGVLQQTAKDVEIIVVDSGSTDETRSIASSYPVKLVTIRPEDFSFGRSLNVGCQQATGSIIVIVSAHVYPTYDDWLEQLVSPFADHRVALVYGKQRGNKITKFSEDRILHKWFPDESNLDQDHPFCNNANAAIRRSLWEELKYDEELTGLEDTDWAKRAMRLDYKISYAANTEVVHVHNEPPKGIYNRYRREAIALKRIFPEEHFGLWDFGRLFLANLVGDYRHAFSDGVLWRNLSGIFSFRLMQFWGTYRGFARQDPVTTQLKRTFYYPNRPSDSRAEAIEDEAHRRIEYPDSLADQPRDGDQ